MTLDDELEELSAGVVSIVQKEIANCRGPYRNTKIAWAMREHMKWFTEQALILLDKKARETGGCHVYRGHGAEYCDDPAARA